MGALFLMVILKDNATRSTCTERLQGCSILLFGISASFLSALYSAGIPRLLSISFPIKLDWDSIVLLCAYVRM